MKEKGAQVFIIFLMMNITQLYGQSSQIENAGDGMPQPATAEQMQWFRDARYGLFIHWSPGCLSGKELSWSRRGHRPSDGDGHYEEEKTVPQDIYDNYYKRFNPTKFNAEEWVKIAKDAGMKYIVFTSKHHDGFSNFHTKYSDYNIANTPFKRDIVKELADACHEAGMRFGIYYSVRDWYHADYLVGDNSRYREFYTGQLKELLTNYGKVDILWFDSTFGPENLWNFKGVLEMIYQLQPDILINDRYGGGWPGDYNTPENRLGAFNREKAWEACACLVDGQWSFRPNGVMLTFDETLGMLLGSVGGDGNLLLDIGPMPNGKIEERQVARLKDVGQWLGEYGKGIYETRGGPYISGYWGYSTLKDDHIYLYLSPWDKDELVLPPIGKKILSSKILNGSNIKIIQEGDKLTIDVPQKDRKKPFTVVELKIDGKAIEISPINVPASGSLTLGKPITAESNGMPRLWWHNPCQAFQAVDDNPNTRWRAEEGSSAASLQVDLGEIRAFECGLIEDDDTVEAFEIQIKTEDDWETIYSGKSISRMHHIRFNSVMARFVRLNILSASDTPSIWEFQLYGKN